MNDEWCAKKQKDAKLNMYGLVLFYFFLQKVKKRKKEGCYISISTMLFWKKVKKPAAYGSKSLLLLFSFWQWHLNVSRMKADRWGNWLEADPYRSIYNPPQMPRAMIAFLGDGQTLRRP
jgi:hypothetical protein